MSNYEKYIFKKNTSQKRINLNIKEHHFHNKFHDCVIHVK